MLRVMILLCALFAPCIASADESPTYNRDIRTILTDHCFACHGPDAGSREADLRLDVEELAHDRVIVAGDAKKSELIRRIESTDPDVRMPPPDSKKPALSAKEIRLLREWIDGGAKYEPHWAYVPPVRPPVPQPKDRSWPCNDFDRFVLARLEAMGIGPAPEADKTTLARRLYFDLVGLPPTPAQIDEFIQDESPDAFARLVDKLLASPAYGERMASWWFDLVRFANTVGYHGDQAHRITPYRDYVIKSFNDNLPFDQFTIEQLAGDLLPNPTMWQVVASGYNRLLQTTHEGGAQDREYRAKYLADRVRNFSETWMAASMGCTECHDHKFDPYRQKDFYSLAAFFADVDHYGSFEPVGENKEFDVRPPEILAWTLPVYEELEKVNAEIDVLEASLVGALKREWNKDKASASLKEKLVGTLNDDWEKRREELTKLRHKRVELEARFEPTMITVAVEPREVRILPRGNWMDQSGVVVEPDTPQCLNKLDVDGRRANRLDLARWTVSRDNPLTARVVANRLLKRFFGAGISNVLIDLGSRGETPVNQPLLDWLAVEFMDSVWDIKHLIRLIVTSSAYRQSSLPCPEAEAVDPDNRFVSRQARFRLDAEQIRDNALLVSGLLVNKIGGETVRPYQPAGYYSSLNFPEREYKASEGDDQFRRAVYTHWQRQYLHPWLVAFDAPTREECTADRALSNTPNAALVLLNDPSYVEAARALATRVLIEGPSDVEARAGWAWKTVLGRNAQPNETAVLLSVFEKHHSRFKNNPAAAESVLSIGISRRPNDVDPVELAAWTSVCRVLLNLNETITRN